MWILTIAITLEVSSDCPVQIALLSNEQHVESTLHVLGLSYTCSVRSSWRAKLEYFWLNRVLGILFIGQNLGIWLT